VSDRNRSEVRDFLASRRARVSPQQAGLTTYGHRRVPGLRREEVATLAGVSAEYYARLERGNLSGTSDSVLEAVARALQLDEAERAHLFDLARAANASPSSRVRRPAPQRIRPAVQQLLDAMTDTAALVGNGRGDHLAANRLGHAVFAPSSRDRPAGTSPGSPSSTPARATSTPTGTRPRVRSWPPSASRRAATPTRA
jgi:transcriptional regulator with XRE-family HTH domain